MLKKLTDSVGRVGPLSRHMSLSLILLLRNLPLPDQNYLLARRNHDHLKMKTDHFSACMGAICYYIRLINPIVI